MSQGSPGWLYDDGGDRRGGSDGTIGMVDALTGSLSAFGERNQRGRDLALAAVNDVGLDSGELDIIVEDSDSENQGGVSAAQKLVDQDGVPLLIGAGLAGAGGVFLGLYSQLRPRMRFNLLLIIFAGVIFGGIALVASDR